MTTTVIRAGSAVRVEIDELPIAAPLVVPGLVTASSSIVADSSLSAPISINGIPSQYYRVQNLMVDGGIAGSGSFGAGVLQIKWSNDNKCVTDIICKSRGATVGSSVAITSGDVIYQQFWYGDTGPGLGSYMAHAGWIKIAIDGAPLGNPTEIPGWYGLATGTGLGSPGSRYAMEINSRQQVHFPGPLSNAFGPTGASWGANVTLGAGGAAAGGAPLKFTAGSVILTVAEPLAFETDGTDLYFTNAAGTRKKVTLA
jgi:hypothetical protein